MPGWGEAVGVWKSMRDITGSVRGIDGPSDGIDDDPFADLAEIFDSELGREAFHAKAESRAAALPQDRAMLEADFEADFAESLSLDMADIDTPLRHPDDVGQARAARQFDAPGRAVGFQPAERAVSRDAGRQLCAAAESSLESDLELAIRGLSAPANPRDAIVFETLSFAPERVLEEAPREIAAPEMDDFDELIASELAAMNGSADYAKATAHSYQDAYDRRDTVDAAPHDRGVRSYDGADEDDDDRADAAPLHRPLLRRRLRMLAGGTLSLALIAAAGFYVWRDAGSSAGASAASGPFLIKADAEPYKVLPKDPGGRAIPNQNKAVYDRVSAPSVQTPPTQQALVTDAEEPMDLPAEEEPSSYQDLPGVEMAEAIPVGAEDDENSAIRSDGRIETAPADADDNAPIPVLQPRKVRTMVVRPDGTLVAEEPSPAPAAAVATMPVIGAGVPALIEVSSPARAASLAPASAEAAGETRTASAPASGDDAVPMPSEVEVTSPAAPAPVEAPVPARPAVRAAAVSAPVPAPAPASVSPAMADPVEVASLPAPAAALPAGGYFVQISSQPSQALAQKSLTSLASRFSAAIAGRGLGIQPADIPGKGTFYRVRVAAASKAEASELCARLKSAGGSCFVTR